MPFGTKHIYQRWISFESYLMSQSPLKSMI